MNQKIGIFDIETDSPNPIEANLKYFGFYSLTDDKLYSLDYTEKTAIQSLLTDHNILIGFNNKHFDQPIIEDFLKQDIFKYKIILDLWEIAAPKGEGGFGQFNKNRLREMGFDFKNYKLKTICDGLKLDEYGKGDIDYNIFKKDKWSKEEILEIEKYLKQDLVLTKKLYLWFEDQYKPLWELLTITDQRKFKHLNSSTASLSYAVICNQSEKIQEWNENKPNHLITFPGGHHINPRWKLVTGNLVEIDFSSAYPHALMMGNLLSPLNEGWTGNNYYTIEGCYNNKKMGNVESALNKVFLERLKAKQSGDTAKDKSYKLVINSFYGLCGNWRFKTFYNPITASDCTHIVRTWLKKMASHLEENGFSCLYGFTDSIFVKIPKESNKEELMFIVNKVLEEFKANMPFPLDTFKMDVDEELKLIWFIAKNCYLFVTNDNKVKYKSTLLNKNSPDAVMEVFNKYISPKIIKELDVNFTKKELIQELKKAIDKNIRLAAEFHTVKDISQYKYRSSIQAQISEKYGSGEHLLIPNTAMIGIGKATAKKGTNPVRYCNIEEFKENKLTTENISFEKLIKHLKPFTYKESKK